MRSLDGSMRKAGSLNAREQWDFNVVGEWPSFVLRVGAALWCLAATAAHESRFKNLDPRTLTY